MRDPGGPAVDWDPRVGRARAAIRQVTVSLSVTSPPTVNCPELIPDSHIRGSHFFSLTELTDLLESTAKWDLDGFHIPALRRPDEDPTGLGVVGEHRGTWVIFQCLEHVNHRQTLCGQGLKDKEPWSLRFSSSPYT